MSKNKVIKSVAFNITNPKDAEFLERIQHVNFSGYVKKLIDKDIKSRKVITSNYRNDKPTSIHDQVLEIKVGGAAIETRD